jgi:hypothetical protein
MQNPNSTPNPSPNGANPPVWDFSNPPPNKGTPKIHTGYQQAIASYKKLTEKETLIQIIGSFFAIFAVYIDFLMGFLIFKLFRNDFPGQVLLRHAFALVLLGLIAAMGIAQLRLISEWNKGTFRDKSSLTQLTYGILDKLSQIRKQILITTILGIVFLILFHLQTRNFNANIVSAELPITLPNYSQVYETYVNYRRLAWILVFIYVCLETSQLMKWAKRMKSAAKLEKAIIHEIPDIQELEDELKK